MTDDEITAELLKREELIPWRWYESALHELQDAREERRQTIAVITRIERWVGEFPETGRTWDDGSPMSYGEANGSNGERDYMRALARDLLATLRGGLWQRTHQPHPAGEQP